MIKTRRIQLQTSAPPLDESELLRLRTEACRSLAIVLLDIAREKIAQEQLDRADHEDRAAAEAES